MSARRQERITLKRGRRRPGPDPVDEARVERPARSEAASAAADRLLERIDQVLSS